MKMKLRTPIGEIPLLEDYDDIIQAARAKKLVLFIGAGVSKILGCPSWDDLAKEYLRFVQSHISNISYSEIKHLEKQDARKLISICAALLAADTKKHVFPLKKILKPKITPENKKYKEIFKLITRFNCPYVTTNIDELLDLAVDFTVITNNEDEKNAPKLVKPRIYHHWSALRTPELLNPNDVVHIHGSVNDLNKNRPPVLTIEEYFQAYSRSKNNDATDLPEFLSTLFSEKVVLFIGYGLQEYEVLEFMVRSINSKTSLQHYMLSPFFEEESNVVRLHELYYKQLGINLIPYSISRLGYGQLFHILDEWSKIIQSHTQSKRHLDNLATIDSIL